MVEAHVRLAEIEQAVRAGGDRRDALAAVAEPAQIARQDARWFAERGCYLTSTACLFASIDRVRRHHPFLSL